MKRPSPKRDAAVNFLLQVLGNGPVKVEEIETLAREAGIARKTLKEAKEKLRVDSSQIKGRTGHFWFPPKQPSEPETCPALYRKDDLSVKLLHMLKADDLLKFVHVNWLHRDPLIKALCDHLEEATESLEDSGVNALLKEIDDLTEECNELKEAQDDLEAELAVIQEERDKLLKMNRKLEAEVREMRKATLRTSSAPDPGSASAKASPPKRRNQ
jgi:hypothetical protein